MLRLPYRVRKIVLTIQGEIIYSRGGLYLDPPFFKIQGASVQKFGTHLSRKSYTELNLFHPEVLWNSSLQDYTPKPTKGAAR